MSSYKNQLTMNDYLEFHKTCRPISDQKSVYGKIINAWKIHYILNQYY